VRLAVIFLCFNAIIIVIVRSRFLIIILFVWLSNSICIISTCAFFIRVQMKKDESRGGETTLYEEKDRESSDKIEYPHLLNRWSRERE
jgi:hypothetical protein